MDATRESAGGEECVEELVELLALRRDRFGLTADAFSRETPEAALVRMIGQAREAAAEGFDDSDGSIEAVLGAGLRSLACDDVSAFATKTRTEYARLFLGPREVVAPLHESAYLSGTSRMFTAETLAVRAFYERHGYTMRAKNREPEDAIGTECEFVRNLCDRCLSLLGGACADGGGSDDGALEEAGRLLRAQKDFEERHLNRWARLFAQRVIDGDASGYYAVWARFLVGVLDEDDALLDACAHLLARVPQRAAGVADDVLRAGGAS